MCIGKGIVSLAVARKGREGNGKERTEQNRTEQNRTEQNRRTSNSFLSFFYLFLTHSVLLFFKDQNEILS